MQLLFLQSLFSEETLRAVCWTLIHSLWQGLLAAAIAGIIIISTRKSAARLRYNLFFIVLALFVATGIGTFFQQLSNSYKKERQLIEITAFGRESFNTENTGAAPVSAGNTIDDLVGFLNQNADLFVLAWFAFFLLNCIKLLTGLAGIKRLRIYRAHIPGKNWQETLNELSRKLNVQQSVSLLESELVKIPVAIGFFKPVILVPLGLLSNLPPAQAETILLHELAHIMRKDYVMNVLQRFTEAVYFFNPSFLWISSLIRQEREACCDDIVMANTHHKGSYLEALVSFQEYSLSNPGYAMAISSKKHYLLNRVKRMLTQENKKLNLMEKILLIAGLSIVTAFTLIPKDEMINKKGITAIEPEKKLTVPKQTTTISLPGTRSSYKPVVKKGNKQTVYETPIRVPSADTVPAPKEKTGDLKFPGMSSTINDDGKTKTETTTVTDQDGKKYTYTKLNNKVTSLSINGKAIPESEIGNYSALFEQIERGREENKARRLKDMELRKFNMARRAEEFRNKAAENQMLREYQNKQRQLVLEQSRQSERSRRIFENKQREMMRLLEKQRRLERVPMINGREVIRNNVHLDNSTIADVHVKNDVNVEKTRLSQNLKNEIRIDYALGENILFKSNTDIALKLDMKTDVYNNLEKFEYNPGMEELKLYQSRPARKTMPVKLKTNSRVFRKRVTT